MSVSELKKNSTVILLWCWVALLSSSLAQNPPLMPTLAGDSLAGTKVVLPDAAAGKVAVLIFGFTHASKVPTGAWADKIRADFGTRPSFEIYQLPVLEDVPRFVRGMVTSGIRKGVPENVRDHFIPILHGEADLKKLVSYKEQDDAYIVILGRTGTIVQKTHGVLNDANYAPVKSQIESLLKEK